MEKAGLQSVLLPGSDQPVELHFHDLRGTAVTLLSEAGCTPQQIATITGHSLKTVHSVAIIGLLVGMAAEEARNLGLHGMPRSRTTPLTNSSL